jgi:PAS domain S-box-containing protein
VKSAPEIDVLTSFLASGGDMGRRLREFDWSVHPLGPPERWPQSLKIVIRLMLHSRFAMWLGWGPEFYFFCNDAYAPTLGLKREGALGLSARKVWEEIWHDIGPRAESVVLTGEATWDESLLLFLERSGYPEETYHTFSYSPVPHDDGSIGGMLCVVTEETDRVIGERRLALLRDLGADLAAIKVEAELFRAIQTRLAEHSKDLPFALIYLLAEDEKTARLTSSHHARAGTALAPHTIALGSEEREVWPAARLFETGAPVLVENLDTHFGAVPAGPWDTPPRSALLVPIAQQGQEKPAGFLVAGLNPYRPLGAAYRGFLDLFAAQIAAGLASVRAYEAERRRAEALAEIDRAKTTFFSNVSHEFRTPLTLLLGPLEEIVGLPEGQWPSDGRALLTVAHRNGLRLLKLVNSLLDFARIEAGRTRAHFEPVDLAAYTAELASSFRSAMEKAGLDFKVDCPPLAQPVYLDREMWEKIVLNLLSNAFKFTLRGEVRVTVKALGDAVEMTVRDTGAGIPEEAMPHLFERFYRVQGAPGRTHEGSGIGLALVHELVKLHGGTVRVESAAGQGSAFIVTIPRGIAHLPPEQCAATPAAGATASAATAFVAEALRWLPDYDAQLDGPLDGSSGNSEFLPPSASRPRILLADDNADMREYIARLLSPRFEVTAVADGQAALEAGLDQRPDLVLTDVMMPRLDGFGLLRAMRAEPALQAVPIILLSARAGEDARVEGIEAGADDYLTKPFHARELLAKVSSTLALAQVRAEAMAREAELRAEQTEILESMNLAFMAMDADFRIFYLNAEAGRLHGMTQEKYLGRVHWEAFPESRGTLIETNYRRVMTERIAMHFENYYEPWQRWFELNAYPMAGGRLGVFFRDITELKQAEAALRDSEARFRLIANTMPQMVWVTHPDGRHEYFNRRWYEFTGAPDGSLGPWPHLFHPDDEARVRAHWQRCRDSGELYEIEYRLRRHDGPYCWFLCRALPVRDDHGQIVRWFGTCTDIDEFKRVEAALQDAKAAAETANRSKDRFLAVLSHELRTPLTPVLMAVGALEHDPELPQEVREDLTMIKRNIELETKLIDDLLDLNRVTSGKLPLHIEPLDLNEAVREVCTTCRPPLRDRAIRLETILDEDAGLVACDRARLQQVLWNVLKNAIKFTPEEGTIRVTTKRLAHSRCEVRIQDSGMGIPADVLPRIFNAFEQGDAQVTRQFGGLGLGLAICKALVDLHHGSIRAESAGAGQGATFIIELPEAPPSVLEKAAAALPADDEISRQLRVLLVEDHPDTALTLSRLLRQAGFVVVRASDVSSAAATAGTESFDVLVSDLGLPDGSGYDVIRRVRAHQIVPGIAMSGYGMEEDVRRTREAGFTEHLVKPVEVSQLIAAIRRVAKDRG